jgi:hypothetical protein
MIEEVFTNPKKFEKTYEALSNKRYNPEIISAYLENNDLVMYDLTKTVGTLDKIVGLVSKRKMEAGIVNYTTAIFNQEATKAALVKAGVKSNYEIQLALSMLSMFEQNYLYTEDTTVIKHSSRKKLLK